MLSPVPAYSWVYGCTAVSAAMIVAYYDLMGCSNMYAGPANGGVAPMNDTVWPTWNDGYDNYPNLPIAASHNGVDGRTTRGSIDDYWIRYENTDEDPFASGGWSEHAYGSAVGDYMKTSQHEKENSDGSTMTYYLTASGDKLTCATLEDYGTTYTSKDGMYGRKLFYEARGYSVPSTSCYTQLTSNQNSDGFSFADYQAEIDAGHPVMINLEGHSVEGIGYSTSGNIVYIHDTWDYEVHSFTWGGSYSYMDLFSVSIVHVPFSSGQDSNSNSNTDSNAAADLANPLKILAVVVVCLFFFVVL